MVRMTENSTEKTKNSRLSWLFLLLLLLGLVFGGIGAWRMWFQSVEPHFNQVELDLNAERVESGEGSDTEDGMMNASFTIGQTVTVDVSDDVVHFYYVNPVDSSHDTVVSIVIAVMTDVDTVSQDIQNPERTDVRSVIEEGSAMRLSRMDMTHSWLRRTVIKQMSTGLRIQKSSLTTRRKTERERARDGPSYSHSVFPVFFFISITMKFMARKKSIQNGMIAIDI